MTYPNMMEFFESLGVDMELSDMSFAVSLDNGRGCEWGSRNGFSSLFAQKTNILNPYFLQMIREIVTFKHDVLRLVIISPSLSYLARVKQQVLGIHKKKRVNWPRDQSQKICLKLGISHLASNFVFCQWNSVAKFRE